MMLDYGMFFEFVPLENINETHPKTYLIEEIELNKNYALILTSNAGLWRYSIGDTIKFTNKYPFRFMVTGRVKNFINAFGEELIIENAEKAIAHASCETEAEIVDYTAGPIYMENGQKGTHQWLIEFKKQPSDITEFTIILDDELKKLNSDYQAKRKNNLNMSLPIIQSMPENTFYDWLKNNGKLGGQHKIPRLSNNRNFIEKILSNK
jgi:hypothetical protein